MGKKIVTGTMYMMTIPKKVWWKPWTWFAGPKIVEVPGVQEVEVTFGCDDEDEEDFLQ